MANKPDQSIVSLEQVHSGRGVISEVNLLEHKQREASLGFVKPGSAKPGLFFRIGRTACLAVPVLVSLLCFPSVTPWVAAFWLLWHTIQTARRQLGWMPLVACLMILLVKLLPRTPLMLLFGMVMLSVAWMRYRRSNAIWQTAILWLAWCGMCYEWRAVETCSHPTVLNATRPIVCLGDSLTEGLLPDKGYPEQLKRIVSVPVVNLGFSGISVAQGVGQIDRVLSHDPQVVIIELGGHDFLKWRSRAATRESLVRLIESCRAKNAEVILMEIPRGFIFDPYASLEREIAYEHDVQIVSDTWLRQIVLFSPIAPPGRWLSSEMQLSDDGIHSNARGSRAIANRVSQALREMYGSDVLN